MFRRLLPLQTADDLTFHKVSPFTRHCEDLQKKLRHAHQAESDAKAAFNAQIADCCQHLMDSSALSVNDRQRFHLRMRVSAMGSSAPLLDFEVQVQNSPVFQVLAHIGAPGQLPQLSNQRLCALRHSDSGRDDEADTDLVDWPLDVYAADDLMSAMSLCHAFIRQFDDTASHLYRVIASYQHWVEAKAQNNALRGTCAATAVQALRSAFSCVDGAVLMHFWQQDEGVVLDLLRVDGQLKNEYSQNPSLVLFYRRYLLEIAGQGKHRQIRAFSHPEHPKQPYDGALDRALQKVNSDLRQGIALTADRLGCLSGCIALSDVSDEMDNYLKSRPAVEIKLLAA